jgi:hypothetical protein
LCVRVRAQVVVRASAVLHSELRGVGGDLTQACRVCVSVDGVREGMPCAGLEPFLGEGGHELTVPLAGYTRRLCDTAGGSGVCVDTAELDGRKR